MRQRISIDGKASNVLLCQMPPDLLEAWAGRSAARCRMTRKARLFLASYRETWSITESAKRAGVTRSSHYKRLSRDPRYKDEFEDIEELIRDTIRAEIHRRALDGVDIPIFYQGNHVHTIKKYSDTLLLALAKAHCPEFRDPIEVQRIDPGVTLRVEFVDVENTDRFSTEALGAIANRADGERTLPSKPKRKP